MLKNQIMMTRSKEEDKFYSVLKNIFIGAQIEGNSGYVNLMRIKSQYYTEFKQQLVTDIRKKLNEVGDEFKEELYNKLYTFFKKYFSESGSIYFSYTPLQERVYERIYHDDKDVMLFWKTHMLYYVKTERLYQNMDFQDEDNLIWYYFDVSELEHKKNNEKKDLVFEYENSFREDSRKIFFKVKYAEKGSKTKTEDILKKIKKSTRAFGGYKEEELKRALGIFRKQSEVDYFINKNARAFLREQFSLWIKTYVFDDESVFEEKRLKQMKALRDVAYNIIDLVSQFEDELVKIWNKPKFAHSANYVLTLDKIEEKDFVLLEKILRHKGVSQQIKEWQALGMCNEKFNISEVIKDKKLSEQWKYLPLDTQYFKKFEYDILALFDDLDNQLDGWLIHSENYQALNTLKGKFYKKIDTIYIDPPYNAQSSEIIYVNNYKHSSWLTLMENRIEVSKKLLTKNGIFECAIDDNENERLGLMLENQFVNHNKTCVTIVHNPSGTQSNNFSVSHEYTYVVYPKIKQGRIINFESRDDKKADIRNFMNTAKGSGNNYKRISAVNCFYPIKIKDTKIIEFGEVCENEFHPEKPNILNEDGSISVYPIDIEGIERKWVFSRNSVESIKNELFIKKIDDEYRIYRKKNLINYKTVWTDIKYSAKTYGTILLTDMGIKGFDFPKSIYNTQDFVRLSTIKNAIILDYFPGSGTTAHAVIELNKEDEGKRKFILTELGDHFNTAIIPRIKKVSFTDKWKEGKAQDGGKGYSNFFKYYELEQYEESLRKTKYEDKDALPKDIYHQYLFFKDLKLADEVINMDKKSRSIKVDLTQLHSKIDIPETLSFLTGKFIKQILKDKVIFTDDSEIVYANIDYKIIKPLIWW